MHTAYTYQQLDIPAVLDNTLIATVLSATFFSRACWLVTAITCTDTLTNWVDSYFGLLWRKKNGIYMITNQIQNAW